MKFPHQHTPKIALIYDRVNTEYGGAEQVLTSLFEIFPNAPLYTSVYDSFQADWAKGTSIKTSFLQRIPILKKFHRSLVWLMPIAFETLQLREFDIIISVTSAEAKGVITSPDQLHICYLLTPTRYLWSHQQEYQTHWLTGWIRKYVFRYLQWWDIAAAARPDVIVPISELVKQRTEKYYSRKTDSVIYPPVQLPEYNLSKPQNVPQQYFLIVSRLVSYKRIDIAIQACQKLNKNLVIIGEGPDLNRLKRLVKQNESSVVFLSGIKPPEIAAYYQHSHAFLAPAEEDFGIATIESLQAGRPAIVYHVSGAAELVKDGLNGLHLKEQSVEALTRAIKDLESKVWNEKQIKLSVAGQSAVQFQSQFKKMVDEKWSLFEKGFYV